MHMINRNGGMKISKNLQPHDATLHTRDENKAAHNMDSWATASTTQDKIALLKTIRDINHKKDGGADTTTILDLVRMDKDMFLSTKPQLSSYQVIY